MRVLFFFFQAEDGIRDLTVTGVQTCALPISNAEVAAQQGHDLFQFLSPPGAFEPQVLDMADVVKEAERQNGPIIDLCKRDRKSTRLNSSHSQISYAVFCLKKKKTQHTTANHTHNLHTTT